MVNKFDIKSNLLETYNINCFTRNITEDIGFHGHDFYELEIVLDGTFETVINDNTFVMKRGSTVLLTPTDIHCYKNIQNTTILNLTFIPDVMEYSSCFELLYPLKYIYAVLDESKLADFNYYIDKMVQETKSSNEKALALSKKYISSLLSCLLIELYRLSNMFSDHIYPPVQKAVYFIRSHFKEAITLQNVAENCNLSVSTLNRKLNDYLNMSFKEYLITLRLEYAKQLIVRTSLTITDIAFFSGFNSLSYFQRTFMKKYGFTPNSFRKSNINPEEEITADNDNQ